MKKERRLTPQEERRKQAFSETKSALEADGFVAHDVTMSALSGNILGFFPPLPLVVLLLAAFLFLTDRTSWNFTSLDTVLFWVLLVVCFVVHELIHGLVWGIFAKKHFASIEFGVIWKLLTPYCCCTEPLSRSQYILGSIMPTLILGVGLGTASVLTESVLLMFVATVMLFGGGGDFLIILKTLGYRQTGSEALYHDHPYELGLVVFER